MKLQNRISVGLLSLCLVILPVMAKGQPDDPKNLKIRITPASSKIYMLDCIGGFGGGNIAAFIGNEGILLVDAMFRTVVPKVIDTLKSLSPQPVRFVLNSHFHVDHLSGNSVLGQTAIVIGHDHVRTRLMAAYPNLQPDSKTLPVITFNDRMQMRFNGETIELQHFSNGHTDSDIMVYFKDSKVAHLGDMFFNGMFPGIYADGGGNLKNLIKNLETILSQLPKDVMIIPGHGDIADYNTFEKYIEMLKETSSIVESAIAAGKSLSQMTEEKILSKYAALGDGGGQSTDQYLAMLHALLVSPNMK